MTRDERMEELAAEMYEALCGVLDVLKDYAPYHEVVRRAERILRRIDDCELKACPFCGSNRVMEYTDGGEEELYGVMCMDCKGSGGMGYRPEDAREHWNRRSFFEEAERDS